MCPQSGDGFAHLRIIHHICTMQVKHLVLTVLGFALVTGLMAQVEVQAMTFNIRYDNPEDPLLWKNRRDEVATAMIFHDIVGVQEALYHQVLDLHQRLPDHDWFGVGREDGMLRGEFCPVFYNRHTFTFVHGETIWLSPNSRSAGSIGWDAVLPRIATILILQHNATGKTVRVINTHFSHVGEEARENSARLIRGYAVNAPEDFTLIMGDMNATPEEPASEILAESPFEDSYYSSEQRCRPQFNTWCTFYTNEPMNKRIDHIYVNFPVVWTCIEEVIKWGYFISDHHPVYIVFRV
ncbi:MAG: hypothetical protein RL226_1045 [Bacteroidota bacterium]